MDTTVVSDDHRFPTTSSSSLSPPAASPYDWSIGSSLAISATSEPEPTSAGLIPPLAAASAPPPVTTPALTSSDRRDGTSDVWAGGLREPDQLAEADMPSRSENPLRLLEEAGAETNAACVYTGKVRGALTDQKLRSVALS
jgi:hypothetical protein